MSFARVAPRSRSQAVRDVFGLGWFYSFRSLLVCWHERVRQRKHLNMLDDRLLVDLGLTRSDVNHESQKPFWQA